MTAVFDVGTVAPTHRPNSRRLDAYVLSTDDAFTLEVGQVIGERLRMRPIDNLDELPQDNSQPWLVLLDASQNTAHALVSAIDRDHSRIPVIAIVPDAAQVQWLGAVARGSISAIIGRGQLSASTLNDALVAVERRLNAGSQSAVAPVAISSATPRPLLPAAATPFVRSPIMRWWPVAAAAVLLVVAWLVLGRKTAAPNVAANVTAATGATSAAAPALAPTVAPPVATPELTHRTVLELLSQARIVFRDQTRMLPRFDTSRVPRTGDSALELYAEVLLRDARNEEARDGVRRLGSAVQARVQSDLSAGQIDNATRIVAAYSSAGGDPVQIQKLTADIKSAQPRLLAGQAQHAVAAGDFAAAEQLLTQLNAVSGDRKVAQDLRRAIDSRQTDLQLQKLGEEVRGAIAAGALLEPAATSARAKLMAMRQLNGKHSATISAQRELQSALLSRASEQQQAQQYDAALRWNSAAVDLGATDEGNEQRIRIRADMDRQATRAAAVAATAAPAPTVAAAVKPAFVIAKAIRPLNVEYPESMLSTAIVGSVVVEFTLRADGSATDVAVVESTPPGTFDKVATAAVARGRFDTSPLGQGKQPKRARIKLSFRP